MDYLQFPFIKKVKAITQQDSQVFAGVRSVLFVLFICTGIWFCYRFSRVRNPGLVKPLVLEIGISSNKRGFNFVMDVFSDLAYPGF